MRLKPILASTKRNKHLLPVTADITSGNSLKQHKGMLGLDVWKNFVTDRVVSRNRLLREVAGSLSLHVLKSHLDLVLRDMA